MKWFLYILLGAMLLSSLTACGSAADSTQVSNGGTQPTPRSEMHVPETSPSPAPDSAESSQTTEEEEDIMYIHIADHVLTATLADNSSAKALKELLSEGPVTIDMQDYGGFEKVGTLGTSLPQNDVQITTGPGDLILYQGNRFVIYYDTNSWSFTRLGKINDITQEELKDILGGGNVTVTLLLDRD